MTPAIESAIADMKLAASMAAQASALFLKASKKLAQTEAKDRPVKARLTDEQLSKLIGARMKKITIKNQ